jgi:hypothetical protein
MTRLTNPQPLFLDARGSLLDAGYVYVGVANADPQAQPISVFFDVDRTIPAVQPLRTLGGVIVNGATPAQVFFVETDYSLRVLDADQQLIRYNPTAYPIGAMYQPLDSDLTAIAALGTTDYGRGLLTLASQAALRQATGIPDPLPLSGGQMTGNITRQNAGVHTYWANPAMTGGREYLTVSTASDPTSAPGDVWYKYVA